MQKLLCLSGDFTVAAGTDEFQQAIEFVKRLKDPQKGLNLDTGRIFVCPGNHDLDYNQSTPELRWFQYASFLSRVYQRVHEPADAAQFGGVGICDDPGVIVLSLNSEMEVHNTPGDATRGDLSQKQLAWAKAQLNQIPEEKRQSYIKVALLHHHPILLPTLAEAGRGYDAINGAQHLLTLLHKFGFHVLLHGHKHHPHTFHESVRNAFERTDEHALVIVAGGTCGSKALPEGKNRATQTYNRIRIHWDPEQRSTRVQVVTRGLVRQDADDSELLVSEWHWETIATDDRSTLLGGLSRPLSPAAMRYELPEPLGDPEHEPRIKEYARTRGNFPTAEVRPSLLPGQTNEVLLRITRHAPASGSRAPTDDPVAVTWSAGHKFPKVRITREDDPEFGAVFAYYGGALMRGELEFSGGERCDVYIYAPMLPAGVKDP